MFGCNHNMLKALMTSSDCLKWPETPVWVITFALILNFTQILGKLCLKQCDLKGKMILSGRFFYRKNRRIVTFVTFVFR